MLNSQEGGKIMSCEWQYISSKNNPLVVRLAKLKDKKYRKAESLFRFDGIKLFEEAVSSGAPIKYVLLSESAHEKYKTKVEAHVSDAKLCILSEDVFAKMTDELSPEGIITVCSFLTNVRVSDNYSDIAKEASLGTVLMLESVRDAGNLGTIIRSARAFGIGTLIMSSDCADLYNSKTVRAAMGALFVQNIVVVESIVSAVEVLRENGSHVYAAALQRDAKKLGSVELFVGDAIIVGNEGHGLSSEVIEACDECLFIPMQEGSESLNASIAASICMWELYKI